MNETERAFFEHVATSLDFWVEATTDCIEGKGSYELLEGDDKTAHDQLRKLLRTAEDKQALRKILSGAMEGLMHSFFVLVDGGADFDGKVDVTVRHGKKRAVKLEGGVHEKFVQHLFSRKRTG